ncbi:hypothetical protein SteCoe_5284 [Stentor coeruleus]|uniref:GAF domain-containing protein n=1 Tax=Stentor coeruleus TaxID=5963 RepID=A0A1R2CSX3_9CILI|nr:hypothetical protein SteCoe_5284 [Stentor coeruleus]
MKFSTSEAFSDMIFSPSKTPFPKSLFEKKNIEVKRPSSHSNSRNLNYRRQDHLDLKPSKEFNKNIDSLITSLMDENKKLKEELDSMRKINKKLLESEKLTNEEYKAFYQTILVDHLQKKVENLDEEANFYRLESQKNSMELGLMKRDKKYIKALAMKYKNQTLNKYTHDVSPDKKTRSAHISKERLQNNNKQKKISNLTNFISQLQKKSNFLEILSSIAEFLKCIFKAEKVSMILVSEEIKDLYAKHVKNFFRHNWNEMRVILAEGPHLSPIELTSLHIEQIKAGFTTGKEVYSTITFSGEPSIYICLHRKIPNKNEFGLYTAADYSYLCLVSTCAGLALNFIKSKQRAHIESEHVLELSTLISSLIYNKNHKELSKNIYTFIPKYLEFEYAGVVFFDYTHEELFMMIPTESYVDKFSDTSIKFPKDLGITGDVFKKNMVFKVDNVKSHRLFNTEIDNSCKSSNIQNAIFASLIGLNGEAVGVLQIFNKKGGKNINEKDVEKVRNLQKIIGVCISSTNCIAEASSLTILLKQGVQKAISSIEDIERNRNNRELFEIKNVLNTMKANMHEWNNQKRIKSFILG